MTTAAHTPQDTNRPILTVVKDNAPAPVEGTVVEHQGTTVATRPAWLTAAQDHVRANRMYAPWVARGYWRLARSLFAGYRDDYPQMIATAKAARKAAAGDAAAEAKAHALVETRRADYRRHRLIYSAKAGGWAALAGTGATITTLGAPLLDIPLALAALGLGAWHGRPAVSGQQNPLAPGSAAMHPGAGVPPTAGDEKVLAALKKLGFEGEIIQPLTRQPDQTLTITVDLDDTVTALKSKTEALAGALKRDVPMVDVSKGTHANQAHIWLSDTDPFETTRPSPLVQAPGPIDAWNDGVPVGWGKRGNTVRLLIRNQHTLIGGTTRSGKGVGMANLLVGAAMDPRINLRIVAGKENGEFDALGRAGVAATYFKPDPARLLALTEALTVDMDRRNRILGELGKSKMTEDTILRLGGIELVVIDEVATYTSPGSHDDRDQLLEKLMKLAAVATGAGILLVLTTQLPQVDVIPTRLSMNCGTKWAMKVDSGTQSNTILGSGLAGSGGPDASKFDPPRPGLGWLNNPFAGGTDLARSFDLDEDERGEVTLLMRYAAKLREDAGRLAGQWDDPIEQHLIAATGLSSAAGGPERNGRPGRAGSPDPGEILIARVIDVLTDAKVDRMKTEPLVEALRDRWYPDLTPDRFKELMKEAGAGIPVTLGPIGEEKNPRGFKLQTLTALRRP
ncbi:FtsK/SpoIIIE domain-containing protein [Streptomyces nymphaeiformis]|uniref:S-DNA-T family DNA segregation ATPase FtsK/SpoIIIE n=1 Tax=Streptomyces nymphaeiformis TaxID=2663842 RepID=A0A7W7XDQ8_9ACTN|nr:FtsK/SpoIIIE domain-containing protein [Streptomyces nymphaeiformis]MBB4985009.1 S-DNA-T family DNA segregation ATPase FtsK/SpoIIIE [Streptomyces nymphaeiformis]